MAKLRIYIDTSVFGGYYDSEFEEYTRPFLSEYIRENSKNFYLLLYKKN
jgi:hypothetical protein